LNVLTIILVVLAVLVVVLGIAGYVVLGRRREAEETSLLALAQQADQHLAAAHAEDKGWERTGLEQAARAAYTERNGAPPRELMLVQVVDRPGVEEDEAVFRADGSELRLHRRGGEWSQAG
jgi:type II secretory pathway pseudopilin PulG